MTKRRKRKTLALLGQRDERVRVLRDTREGRLEVHYRDRTGAKRKRVFDDSDAGQAAAIAWAQSYAEERTRRAMPAAIPDTTTRGLWEAFCEAPMYARRRAATQRSHVIRWRLWEAFITPDRVAATVRLIDVDRFIARMLAVPTSRGAPRAMNQIRQVLQVVRAVYNYGQSRGILATNHLALFRWETPKGHEAKLPDEYQPREFERLLAQLSPQHAKRWRANVALLIAGYSGQRINAIRHLRWRDVDFSAGVITWPMEYQKQGVALERVMTDELRAALLTAWDWRTRVAAGRQRPRTGASGATREALAASDWVLFAEHHRDRPVSYQTIHAQLVQAEARAGVPHRDYRALHGFRRMVVGEVGEATGDVMRGLEYVGDRDPKQRKSYDRRAQRRVDEAAGLLSEKMSLKRPSALAAETADAVSASATTSTGEPAVGIEPTTARNNQ